MKKGIIISTLIAIALIIISRSISINFILTDIGEIMILISTIVKPVVEILLVILLVKLIAIADWHLKSKRDK